MEAAEETTVMRTVLGDSPKVRLMEILLVGRDLSYCITELAKHAGTSRSVIYPMIEEMQKDDLVIEKKQVGRIRLFGLNTTNKKVRILIKMFDSLLSLESEKEIARQTIKVKAKN